MHEGATHELKPSPSASRLLRSSSDPLPIRSCSFPALLPQPAPVPNPIRNSRGKGMDIETLQKPVPLVRGRGFGG